MRYFFDIFNNWINSFNNDKGGFSARKEAAFGAWLMAIYVTYKWTDKDNLESILTLWLLYSLLCLGIITMQQIAEVRSGKSEKKESTTTTTTKTDSSSVENQSQTQT